MGHADTRILRHYQEVVDELKRDAAVRMDALLGAPNGSHRARRDSSGQLVGGAHDFGEPEQLAPDVVHEPLLDHGYGARLARVGESVSVLPLTSHVGVEVLVEIPQKSRVWLLSKAAIARWTHTWT